MVYARMWDVNDFDEGDRYNCASSSTIHTVVSPNFSDKLDRRLTQADN